MTRGEAVNWIINISADIGKAEYRELWHYEQALSEIRDMLQSEPERKTGKWIQVHGFATPGGDPVWCCSECGKGVHVYGIEHGTYGADISDGQWKACPNCSALMEGE